MINILVIIQVKNFNALEEFEYQANKIMQDHGGKIAMAFESQRNPDDSGEEIHILEFSSMDGFNSYKIDERLHALYTLRQSAITSADVKVSKKLKLY